MNIEVHHPAKPVDQRAEVTEVVAVLLDGAGYQLACLRNGEGRAFFEHQSQTHQEEMRLKRLHAMCDDATLTKSGSRDGLARLGPFAPTTALARPFLRRSTGSGAIANSSERGDDKHANQDEGVRPTQRQ